MTPPPMMTTSGDLMPDTCRENNLFTLTSNFSQPELAREHEAYRTHERRLAQRRGDDARRGQAAPDAALDGLFERGRDDGPGARDLPADDDRLRRESDDEVRDADAEVVGRLGQRVNGRLFAAERALDHFAEADGRRRARACLLLIRPVVVLIAPRVLQVARDRRALGGESLPAVVVAAGAGDGAALPDDHVAELARRAALAAVNLPVEDDACADALGDEHDDEVARAAHLRASEPKLGERGGVGVVVGAGLQTRGALDLFGDGPVAPAEEGDVDGDRKSVVEGK